MLVVWIMSVIFDVLVSKEGKIGYTLDIHIIHILITLKTNCLQV